VKSKILKSIGIIGTAVWLGVYIKYPSFPTPDKLLLLLIFIFMIFSKGWELTKRLGPFVVLLLAYESFRGIVPHLNSHVNYGFMPAADKFLFLGHLPTTLLQNILWNGHVRFYDYIFYGAYMVHFVLPIVLALIIWKYREKFYWRYISTYLVVSFSAFLMFLAFPAAPPWMASNNGVIEPITRISTNIWYAFGIKDFPSLYNEISPNAVAAMPSLHAAYATLLFIFVLKLFGKKWAALAAIYPFLIFVGTVYMGEHYAIDVITGIFFGVGAYYITPYIMQFVRKLYKRLREKTNSLRQTAVV